MKKIIFALCSILLLHACKNETNKVVVEGTIKGLSNGDIYFIQSGDEQLIDTVKVINEKFKFEDTVSEPTVYMVNFGAEAQPGFVILEPGKMTLTYDIKVPQSMEVKGGKEQALYSDFLNLCKPTFISMDSLGKIASAHEDDQALLNELTQQFNIFDSTLIKIQKKFIQDHPSGIASAFIAINYLNRGQDKDLNEMEAIYKGFDNKIQQSYYGKKLTAMIATVKGTSIGQLATNFKLPDTQKHEITLSSFRGKVILLDFWASWCGPCRAENPNVVKAYEKYHSKGFDILGVSLDNQEPQWLAAIEKDHLSWTQVSDLQGWNSSVATTYGIESIPANFLLDQEGRILAKDLRGDELEKKLSELLK